MAKIKTKSKEIKKILKSPFTDYWIKENYLILSVGLVLLIAGFYFMGQGNWDSSSSLVISPILLFITYVVIIPLSIMFRKKKSVSIKEDSNVPSENKG
ncbi:hypothetical protein APF79_06195 [bacterium BRH_c32]|nr:MAG: hypothetical protein APF79_06195 [bacterium BRH_c32]